MNKNLIWILLSSIIGFILSGCSNDEDKNKSIIARVYDKYLYKQDLAGVVQSGLSKEDSINKVKSYIDFWVKRQDRKSTRLNSSHERLSRMPSSA